MNNRLPHLFELLSEAEAELSLFKKVNPLTECLLPARSALETVRGLYQSPRAQDSRQVAEHLGEALDAVRATAAATRATRASEVLYRLRFGIERALAALNAQSES